MSNENETIAPEQGRVPTEVAPPTPSEAMNAVPKPEEQAKSFSQDELERILDERLNRERQKYADYDQLHERSEKLREIEDQNKSEVEKAAEEAAAAKWELETERVSNLRFRAALKHSIPEDYLDLLIGDDEKTITASAERVGKLVADAKALEELRAAEKVVPSTGRPRDNLRPGASPESVRIADDSYPSSWLPRNMRAQQ